MPFFRGPYTEPHPPFWAAPPIENRKVGPAPRDEVEDLYYFGGAIHPPKDMRDAAKQTGVFAPIAEQIAAGAIGGRRACSRIVSPFHASMNALGGW